MAVPGNTQAAARTTRPQVIVVNKFLFIFIFLLCDYLSTSSPVLIIYSTPANTDTYFVFPQSTGAQRFLLRASKTARRFDVVRSDVVTDLLSIQLRDVRGHNRICHALNSRILEPVQI
jgi:hypothetical protein